MLPVASVTDLKGPVLNVKSSVLQVAFNHSDNKYLLLAIVFSFGPQRAVHSVQMLYR